MKTSIITAIFISIIVGGWFISGIYFKDDNKSQNYSTENSDLKKVENSDPDNINDIKVETFLSNADDVDQSIILQGQTKINRSIDIKSETIGRIVMETLSRIDTVAYVRFASVYKNFQELGDFEEFMSELHPSKLEPKKTV